jgi:amidohydrolase
MIEEGLFERFPMESIFAMHNWPSLPEGKIAICDGPIMASSNEFTITLKGKGAHAALPHNGIDPIPVACELVQAFQTILTRNKKPTESGVISVTMIHAGEATNVVPEVCVLRGTVRTFTIELLDLIESRMGQLTQHIAAAHRIEAQFEFVRNYPPTINHSAAVETVKQTAYQLWGKQSVHAFEPTMGAEDFSFFLQHKPGAYFMIGNGDGAHRDNAHGLGPCQLHNSSYDFNDGLLSVGPVFWVEMILKLMIKVK